MQDVLLVSPLATLLRRSCDARTTAVLCVDYYYTSDLYWESVLLVPSYALCSILPLTILLITIYYIDFADQLLSSSISKT